MIHNVPKTIILTTIKVKIILATTAAATPQNKTFCLISEGNDDATIPIIIALSAAKTKSMRIIWNKIMSCGELIKFDKSMLNHASKLKV